jgi:hypothetical protein
MDPQSLVDALRGLWELNIDVVMLVHDNDTTAIKRLREAKQALLKAHPDANMSKCACEAGFTSWTPRSSTGRRPSRARQPTLWSRRTS